MFLKWLRVAGVTWLLGSFCMAQVTQPEPQIAGRVLRADNGIPIEGAEIDLELSGSVQHNNPLQTATTDSQGQYRFSDPVRAGTYFITVGADGYVSETYNRDGTLEGKFQRVDASTRLRGIDFRLRREAIIRGTVTGSKDEPVEAGISVAAVRREKQGDGSSRLRVAGGTETDASGRFVFTKLPPDTYFICVNGPNGFNSFPDAHGWYRETCYENASAAEQSTPIVLSEGEERRDVRIKVERESRYRVVVWPLGPDDSPKVERYQIHIEGRNHSYSQQADGSYVIPDVPPGHYRLVGIAWTEMQYLGEGDLAFDVAGEDVMLHLRVGGLGGIEGVVKLDGGAIPSGLMVGVESGEAAQGADVDPSGHFRFGRVLPGGYTFKFLKNPDGWTLRGVRCGGADVSKSSPLRVGDRERITDCELGVSR
jgi:hypothetical protein